MTRDERELIEEKFKGLHIQLDSDMTLIGKDLTYIKEQTTKTNHRVTCLEELKNEYLKTRVDTVMLKKVTDKIEYIDKNLDEYYIIKKYPKASLILLIVFILSSIVGTIGTIKAIANSKSNKEIIEKVEIIESEIKTNNK